MSRSISGQSWFGKFFHKFRVNEPQKSKNSNKNVEIKIEPDTPFEKRVELLSCANEKKESNNSNGNVQIKIEHDTPFKELLEKFNSYEKMVEYLAKNNINYNIPNGEPLHAAVLISQIFKSAKETVNIFCGNLSDEVYNNDALIDNAVKFVTKRNGKIRIVLEEDLGEELYKRRLLYKVANGIIDSKKESGSLQVAVGTSAEKEHFCVNESGYRMETNREDMTATANFANETTAKTLNKRFDDIFNGSSKVVDIN